MEMSKGKVIGILAIQASLVFAAAAPTMVDNGAKKQVPWTGWIMR
jgi:hypothetical protein